MINNYKKCPHKFCFDPEHNRRNIRTRSSILINADGKNILIDTSMDFREQMLRSRVQRIDAVLYTHGHADHIYGLPDIRSYSNNQKQGIKIFGTDETISMIKKSFSFIFSPPRNRGGGIAEVIPYSVSGEFNVDNINIIPIPVIHGDMRGCVGYRVGKLAYLPDVKKIPDTSLNLLYGLDILILGALRINPHPTHLSLSESISIAEKIGPAKCLFIHMSHDINPDVEKKRIPKNMQFSYDNMVIDL